MNHNSPRLTMLSLVFAAALSGLATGAHADSLEDLKTQLDALMKRVAALEQKQPPAETTRAVTAAASRVTGGATKGSFKYDDQFLQNPCQ